MRVLSYSGTSGDCIEVDKPSDLYPLIEWFKDKMKFNKSSKVELSRIEDVMNYAHVLGLGGEEEIENVKYI